MWRVKLASVVLLFGAAGAQCAPLPDSPTPKVAHEQVLPFKRPGQFLSRPIKIELGAMVGAAAFDMGQTCRNLANGGTERFLPTHTCGGAVAITAGFDAAALGGAWLLHRMHHDKLALVPMAFMSEQSLRAIVYSKQHKAW